MVYYTFLYVYVAFINILFSKGNWTVSASNGVTRTTRRVNISGNFLTYITRYVVYLRYVTCQLFRQFRADQFISKLSIIMTVY